MRPGALEDGADRGKIGITKQKLDKIPSLPCGRVPAGRSNRKLQTFATIALPRRRTNSFNGLEVKEFRNFVTESYF